jgi:hypothetical protein
MKVSPILASDTTAAFLRIAVLFFWIALAGAAVPAILSLGLYCSTRKRQPRKVIGVVLGSITMTASLAALACVIVFTNRQLGLVAWAGVLAPLLLGGFALALWVRREQTSESFLTLGVHWTLQQLAFLTNQESPIKP